MNLAIDVLVNEVKVASKRSWMSEYSDSRYPAVLVYDVEAKIFLDQIAYQPGPISIVRGKSVGGTYNIPEEFRLEFHLTLDPAAEQLTSGNDNPDFKGAYWNILQGTYLMRRDFEIQNCLLTHSE